MYAPKIFRTISLLTQEMRRIDLPMDEAELLAILKSLQKNAIDTFKHNLQKFAKFEKFRNDLNAFEVMMVAYFFSYRQT